MHGNQFVVQRLETKRYGKPKLKAHINIFLVSPLYVTKHLKVVRRFL